MIRLVASQMARFVGCVEHLKHGGYHSTATSRRRGFVHKTRKNATVLLMPFFNATESYRLHNLVNPNAHGGRNVDQKRASREFRQLCGSCENER